MGPGQGFARVVRGLVMSSSCLLLSITAHVAGGGTMHPTPGFLAAGLLLSTLCVLAADRQRGAGGILVVVALSQLVLHMFSTLGAGHHAGAHSTFEPAVAASSVRMAAAHVGAGAVLAVLLTQGERLLWALWRLLTHWARPPGWVVVPITTTFTLPPIFRLGHPRIIAPPGPGGARAPPD